MIESLIQQYLAPIAMALFTVAEWKAFVLLLSVTIAVTQLVKVAWRILPFLPKDHLTYRREIMYLTTTVIGFGFAFPIWPPGFSWWIPGILAGPASAIAFKGAFFVIKRFAPDFAASFNADRRRYSMGPPSGIERRGRKEAT